MKVYFWNELEEKNFDELLDLLFNYIYLRDDMINIIKEDSENIESYINDYMFFYNLNIKKIKHTLTIKTNPCSI
jgi:hypothetical protein